MSEFKIEQIKTAFRGATVTWKLYAPLGNRADEVADLLDRMTNAMKQKIQGYRSVKTAVKFNISLYAMFHQAKDESIKTEPSVVLVTEMFEVYEDTDLDEILDSCSKQLQNRIITYEGFGSGWVLETLEELDTTIWILDPLRAETYHPLSKWIWNTHCVINVQNVDNECFRHAVMAGLFTPENNRNQVYSYAQFYDKEDTPIFNLTYPVKLKDIAKFEKVNDITINVYGINERRVHRKTEKRDECEKTAIDECEETTEHYESISTMSEGEEEEESDIEEENEEDRQFLDDEEYENDISSNQSK
jgi:hypothetical protein